MKLPHLDDLQLPRTQSRGLDNGIREGTAVVRKMTRTLMQRAASNTCKAGDDSNLCQKPTDSSTETLPIVLGAVIPIVCAIIVLIFLHRRYLKKQRLEDANDKHKSLDFGLDMADRPSKGKKQNGGKPLPEMTISGPDSTRPSRGVRGISMDMSMSNPYLLPAGLQGSRESLHSMSRSIQGEHDPYRPVTFMRQSQETTRSPRLFNENGSMYSASTVQTSSNSNENAGLVLNARPMSQSYPKRGDSRPAPDRSPMEEPQPRQMHSTNRSVPASRKTSLNSAEPALANNIQTGQRRKENLPQLPSPPPEPVEEQKPPPRTSSSSMTRPPRKSSAAASTKPIADSHISQGSYYGHDVPPPPPPPKVMNPEEEDYDIDPSMIYAGRFSIDTPAPTQQYPVQDKRLSVMGLRPLPPENLEENAEQRANRIRSFYKEYFDVNRPNPADAQYYEDSPYDAAWDGAIYDPETGEYFTPGQAPFAQPVGRRAMTPPPRAGGGPRFAGHERHYSTQSAGRALRGRPAQRPPPKKQLPPPKPLASLPTPHMLSSDAHIMSSIDWAPPTSFREHQNGRRPDSPMGIKRAYSPSVKAYSPLIASFDELAAMPSPHHLRKSGTFNSLDFAPPRFRGQDGTASDAGSIRSARSGISAVQLDAVRAGAYRVSRIPKEFVTSREDMASQLRPKMNLSTPG